MSGRDASSIMMPRWLKITGKERGTFSILNVGFDFGARDDKWFTQKTSVWSCGSALDFLQQHIILLLPLGSADTLTLCEDRFPSNIQVSSRFNQLALFTKRSQTAFNWFQIEHADTGSSLLAKLALKFKMLRSPLKMCELISLSMVFFLSFEYSGLGSIIHYSWISLCGKNSISKQRNTKFTGTGGCMKMPPGPFVARIHPITLCSL